MSTSSTGNQTGKYSSATETKVSKQSHMSNAPPNWSTPQNSRLSLPSKPMNNFRTRPGSTVFSFQPQHQSRDHPCHSHCLIIVFLALFLLNCEYELEMHLQSRLYPTAKHALFTLFTSFKVLSFLFCFSVNSLPSFLMDTGF